jgi:hypothetical protein
VVVGPDKPSSCFRMPRPSTTETISPFSSSSSSSMIQPPRSPSPRTPRILSYRWNIVKRPGSKISKGNQALKPDPRGVRLMFDPRNRENVERMLSS